MLFDTCKIEFSLLTNFFDVVQENLLTSIGCSLCEVHKKNL